MSQRLIPTGEQSGLLTRIATMENASLCALTKSYRVFGIGMGGLYPPIDRTMLP